MKPIVGYPIINTMKRSSCYPTKISLLIAVCINYKGCIVVPKN